jgi:hypothetical protein
MPFSGRQPMQGARHPEAIRPALRAALLKAEDMGLEVSAIVAGLKSST